MSEFIENPFRDMWDNFNMDDFKAKVCSLLDEMYQLGDTEEMHNKLDELDETVVEFLMMLRLKDMENIEVIKVSDLPREAIDDLGIDIVDSVDGYVPKQILPPDILDKVKKPKRPNRGQDWLK